VCVLSLAIKGVDRRVNPGSTQWADPFDSVDLFDEECHCDDWKAAINQLMQGFAGDGPGQAFESEERCEGVRAHFEKKLLDTLIGLTGDSRNHGGKYKKGGDCYATGNIR
jgi:hypothetical protein